MKRALCLFFTMALSGALSACTSGSSESTSTTNEPTSTTSSTPSASSTSTTAAVTTTAETAPAAEPETAPAQAAAFVIECEPGVPGPALWSDGSTRFSQECYDQGVANRGSYQCPGTDSFVNSASECAPWQREELPADQIPFANGGTCPAYKCGYGHGANGKPNPTSGELQLMDGCENGYIEDPDKCAAVAGKAEQYGW